MAVHSALFLMLKNKTQLSMAGYRQILPLRKRAILGWAHSVLCLSARSCVSLPYPKALTCVSSVPSCIFLNPIDLAWYRQVGPLDILYRRWGREGRQRKDQPANPGVFSPIAYNHLVTSGVPLPCRCILIFHKPSVTMSIYTTKKEVSHFIQLIFPLA